MVNSVDPDQMPCSAAYDLGPHCLLMHVCLNTNRNYGRSDLHQCYILLFLSKHQAIILTLTTLWANSADNKLVIFFLLFPENSFGISCKLSLFFSGNNKRNILKCCQLQFLPRSHTRYDLLQKQPKQVSIFCFVQ